MSKKRVIRKKTPKDKFINKIMKSTRFKIRKAKKVNRTRIAKKKSTTG